MFIISCEKHLRDFLNFLLKEKKRSPRTLANYEFYLERFLHCAKIQKPEEITLKTTRCFRSWLQKQIDQFGRPLKSSTINYHLIALRSFLRYLANRRLAPFSPSQIKLAKLPSRRIAALTSHEMDKLLAAPLLVSEKNNLQLGLRDKAVLEVLFSTGLKVSELVNLKKAQINLRGGEIFLRGWRGNERLVLLSHQALYWLNKYLETRGDASAYLFVSHDRAVSGRQKRSGLTPRSIERLVEKYAKIAGLTKKITPHTLRHTYALALLQRGYDLHSVQKRLGHSTPSVTQIYARQKPLWNRQVI